MSPASLLVKRISYLILQRETSPEHVGLLEGNIILTPVYSCRAAGCHWRWTCHLAHKLTIDILECYYLNSDMRSELACYTIRSAYTGGERIAGIWRKSVSFSSEQRKLSRTTHLYRTLSRIRFEHRVSDEKPHETQYTTSVQLLFLYKIRSRPMATLYADDLPSPWPYFRNAPPFSAGE